MMRNRRLLPCWMALLACVVSGAKADEPEKYALIAGVTKYQHADMNKAQLEFPEVDAKSLAEVLRSSGYTVDLLLGKQATQKAIREKLDAFNRRANSDGVALIALFGHGTEPVNTNTAYFCPYDTTLRVVRDKQGRALFGKDAKELLQEDPDSLVAMSELLLALKVSPAGNRVLLADCCRNDPNRPRGRAFGAQLKASDIPENTAAFFACSAGEQAFEHRDWGHGAFTKCLLEEMEALAAVGPVRMAALSDRVTDRVEKLVAGQGNGRDRQTPFPFVNGRVDLQLKRVDTKDMRNSVGMDLVLVPAGDFEMGSTKGDVDKLLRDYSTEGFKREFADNEQPQHRVRISQPFYLGKFEVTKGQFAKFVLDDGYKTDAEKDGEGGYGYDAAEKKFEGRKPKYTWRSTGFAYEDNHPVVNVSWNDAKAFCAWLSRKEGKTYRLPTEAEWEYACRAGTTTRHPNGDDESSLARIANIGDQSLKKIPGAESFTLASFDDRFPFTAPVGSFTANKFGLHDMIGNAFEWCEDTYDEKLYARRNGVTTDPLPTSGSEYRVLRGGSWNYRPGLTRSADRVGDSPDLRNGYSGFRVVCVSRPRT
ncbi:MAG: SUMF1/EgtB/PvdO family nonheme iron enzyme [Planctomycetaceae bacterium]